MLTPLVRNIIKNLSIYFGEDSEITVKGENISIANGGLCNRR